MFWVISVYFNIRNTLPKSGTFLLGHPIYIDIYIDIYIYTHTHTHTHTHTSPHMKEGRNVEACMNHNHQTAAVSNKIANVVLCGAVQTTNTFFTFTLLLQIHKQNFIHTHKEVQPSCFN